MLPGWPAILWWLIVLVLAATATRTATATPVVAGPPGGEVRQILVAPSDGRIAYATTGGSLFLTRDGGGHWRLVRGAFGSTLTLFAVVPGRPSVLYGSLATRDRETSGRLRDSGLQWRALGPFLDPGGLAVDPRHPHTLYAHGRWWIWRSADGGARWRGLHLGAPLRLTGGAA